jgi:hypothetical protein
MTNRAEHILSLYRIDEVRKPTKEEKAKLFGAIRWREWNESGRQGPEPDPTYKDYVFDPRDFGVGSKSRSNSSSNSSSGSSHGPGYDKSSESYRKGYESGYDAGSETKYTGSYSGYSRPNYSSAEDHMNYRNGFNDGFSDGYDGVKPATGNPSGYSRPNRRSSGSGRPKGGYAIIMERNKL